MLVLDPPYDRRYPWYLQFKEKRCRISGEAAQYLYSIGVPLTTKGGKISPESVAQVEATIELLIEEDSFLALKVKISKKALTMLQIAVKELKYAYSNPS